MPRERKSHLSAETIAEIEAGLEELLEHEHERVDESESLCEICGDYGGAAKMVICENLDVGCVGGRHYYCFNPPWKDVQKENWYCSFCTTSRLLSEPDYIKGTREESAKANTSSNKHPRDTREANTSQRPKKLKLEMERLRRKGQLQRPLNQRSAATGHTAGRGVLSAAHAQNGNKPAAVQANLDVAGGSSTDTPFSRALPGGAASARELLDKPMRPLQSTNSKDAKGKSAAGGNDCMFGAAKQAADAKKAEQKGKQVATTAVGVASVNAFKKALKHTDDQKVKEEQRALGQKVEKLEQQVEDSRKLAIQKHSQQERAERNALWQRSLDRSLHGQVLWTGSVRVRQQDQQAKDMVLPMVARGLECNSGSAEAAKRLPAVLSGRFVSIDDEIGVAKEDCWLHCALTLSLASVSDITAALTMSHLTTCMAPNGYALRVDLEDKGGREWIGLVPHTLRGGQGGSKHVLLAMFIGEKHVWKNYVKPAKGILKGADSKKRDKSERIHWPDKATTLKFPEVHVLEPGPVYRQGDPLLGKRVVQVDKEELAARQAKRQELQLEQIMKKSDGAVPMDVDDQQSLAVQEESEHPSHSRSAPLASSSAGPSSGGARPAAAHKDDRVGYGRGGHGNGSGNVALIQAPPPVVDLPPLDPRRGHSVPAGHTEGHDSAPRGHRALADYNPAGLPAKRTQYRGARELKGLRYVAIAVPFRDKMLQLHEEFIRLGGHLSESLDPASFDIMLIQEGATESFETDLWKLPIKELIRYSPTRRIFKGYKVLEYIVKHKRLPSFWESEAMGREMAEIYRCGVIIVTHLSLLLEQREQFSQVVQLLEQCRMASEDLGMWTVKMSQEEENTLRSKASEGDEQYAAAWKAWKAVPDAIEPIHGNETSRNKQSLTPQVVRNAVKISHFNKDAARHMILMTHDDSLLFAGRSQKSIQCMRPKEVIEYLRRILLEELRV